jgi:UDP-hydrolysing UDP-N-acetyl-D-glucosamine 2-epimerase
LADERAYTKGWDDAEMGVFGVRTIGVVTVARSDYGIYLPLLRRIREDPDLRLLLIVAGMHLSPEFGLTVRAIEEDGFEIGERVEMLLSSDTPEAISKSMGLGTIGFAQAFARFRPDILLVLGDRFEMHSAAVAAVPFGIPIGHIHGGESTEGVIDDVFRHSITKMSHMHFVANEAYARRVIQMGEEPWRVVISGAPGLDNLHLVRLLSREKLEEKFMMRLRKPILLVTYHPVTLEHEQTEIQVQSLLSALEQVNAMLIFTYPNADTHSRTIIRMINQFVAEHEEARVVTNLGTQAYLSFIKYATAMVGNSSSGIIEAASFKLPVVNIGSRQRGRIRGKNVIDVGYSQPDIVVGIKKALSHEFRASLSDMNNPYGDGHAAERIIERLKHVELDNKLLLKRFYEP